MLIDILGSKKRLEILRHLSEGDKYVSEIMDLASMDGKNAKYHLEKLEKAEIVKSYEKGRRKYYTLKKEIRMEIDPPPEGKFLLYVTEQ